MGIRELKQGAITKERFKDIMTLKKAKEYDKIFDTYGQTIYNLSVSGKYKKQDIKRLLDEGSFEEIYKKYGERTYNSYIYVMQQKDIYYETGSKPKSILNRIKNVLLHRIAPVVLSTALLTPATSAAILENIRSNNEKENSIEYAQEIEDYDKKINLYAQEVNSMNLSDTQIFMKVIKDMWESIDGYASADNEVAGYLRLTLDNEGVGTCRNFADDITAKLNAINPKYNARNVVVYLNQGEYYLANIERNIVEQNDTVSGSEDSTTTNESENILTNYVGNHMVTAVDIPGKNITLILDPTNPGIGVFKNGQIYMFSTEDGNGLEVKPIGQFFQGIDSLVDVELTSLKSFLPCEYTIDELEEIYGTEAQNQALEYLISLENGKDTQEDDSFISKVTIDEDLAIKQMEEQIASSENKSKADDDREIE